MFIRGASPAEKWKGAFSVNVLITDGTGNLGSRLLTPLVQRGDRVTIFDVQSRSGFESRELKEVELIQGDLSDNRPS